MKLQKESLWILLALIVSPFYFVYRETLEVKDGEVRAYKTLWWSRTTEVKSLKPSCVGEVYTKWLHGAVSIEVLDRQGRLFWVQRYQGFNSVGRSCRDVNALRDAIKTGTTFSATYCKSALWTVLSMMISLFTWFYKRAWRLERERQRQAGNVC